MPTQPPHPRTARQVFDTYFLETRAKLLEIAANMDRVARAPGVADIQGDPRLAFIAESLKILQGNDPDKAERIQRLYSK